VEVWLHASLNLAVDRGEQLALITGKEPGTEGIQGWVGPRARLEAVTTKNPFPALPGIDP